MGNGPIYSDGFCGASWNLPGALLLLLPVAPTPSRAAEADPKRPSASFYGISRKRRRRLALTGGCGASSLSGPWDMSSQERRATTNTFPRRVTSCFPPLTLQQYPFYSFSQIAERFRAKSAFCLLQDMDGFPQRLLHQLSAVPIFYAYSFKALLDGVGKHGDGVGEIFLGEFGHWSVHLFAIS